MTHFARFTAALALAGAVLSSPAYAAVDGDARSVTVRLGDLNLDSPAGRASLMQRIAHAAGAVCGRPDQRDLTASRLSSSCRADAVADAMPQVQLALAGGTARQLAANTISVTAKAL